MDRITIDGMRFVDEHGRERIFSGMNVVDKKDFDKAVREAKAQPQYGNGAKHRCTVCGRTELDDPNLEFRYCSKCNGAHEYCQDHLFTHEHIKQMIRRTR